MTSVEPATEEDILSISHLIGEIEAYYGGGAEPGDVSQIKGALFSHRPVATVLLAKEGAQTVGLASYSFLWPAAGAESSLYLKELFVRQGHRRNGVAHQLIAAVREAAAEAGCSRIEWTADRDNPAALHFYDAIGAQVHEGKIFYRVHQVRE
jgi:GNAT superfamily N-acetyltransferase